MNAVCFFCDALEYGGNDIFQMTAEKAVEKFIECIKTFPDDSGLVQSAGYGLGAVAKRAPKGQCPHLVQILQTLKALVDRPESRTNEDIAESTDNVIGALGKAVLFQYDGAVIGVAALKEYLSLLPLFTDGEEAQAVHKLLFEQILTRNPVLANAEVSADVVQCVQRIVRLAQQKPELELLDDDGKAKAEAVVAQIGAAQ